MSVFGFSTEAGTGNADIVPVVKYDSRAGRAFRVDRVQTAAGWEKNEEDITSTFKGLFDFENIETGWAHFAAGIAPSFSLVPMGQPLPPRPSPDHKNCIRFMLKLSKECGGDTREMASQAKAFLSGIESLYMAYLEGVKANPGKLPVVKMVKTTPIKTGSGAQSSTNYAPVFEITGWAPRGDLVFVPKAVSSAPGPTASAAPPSTGSTVVPPPHQVRTPEPAGETEFG